VSQLKVIRDCCVGQSLLRLLEIGKISKCNSPSTVSDSLMFDHNVEKVLLGGWGLAVREAELNEAVDIVKSGEHALECCNDRNRRDN
jgi:hypothetical protein